MTVYNVHEHDDVDDLYNTYLWSFNRTLHRHLLSPFHMFVKYQIYAQQIKFSLKIRVNT